VDKICRISRASHETTRLSASAEVPCLSQSPAVRVRRLSPDTFPQYSQQYTATDGPGAGPSKHLPTSATSHADRPSDRTGSSLRELNTGHRHATHRCHKILQIHRQPRPLSPPKPLVKDWSPFTARQSPRRSAPELSCLVIRSPAGAEHRSHTAERRRRHRSCCGRRKTLANTATLRS
jgi:hypothetical protein